MLAPGEDDIALAGLGEPGGGGAGGVADDAGMMVTLAVAMPLAMAWVPPAKIGAVSAARWMLPVQTLLPLTARGGHRSWRCCWGGNTARCRGRRCLR